MSGLAFLIGTSTLVAAGPAAIAPPDGITITPTRGELDLAEREHSLDVIISNGTEATQDLEIVGADLGHTLEGTPVFEQGDGETMQLETEGRIALAPGESRSIEVKFRFPNDVAVYKAVVARLVNEDGAAAIDVETQLAAIFLLRGPRPWNQSLRGRGVAMSATATDSDVVLQVALENVGDAHVRPSGDFVISLPTGEPVARVPMVAENIIPGYARTLTADWRLPAGLPGEVVIGVELSDGTVVPGEPVDVPEGAADAAENELRGGALGGAFFGGADGGITPLHGLAVLLLLICLAMLWLVAKRRREDEDEPDEGAGREHVTAVAGD
ncbi:MAG: hypothetical protein KY457_00825 [Actinobacteria bacterium]|nr:hypothetical protein [Actinomycetota bacterium]